VASLTKSCRYFEVSFRREPSQAAQPAARAVVASKGLHHEIGGPGLDGFHDEGLLSQDAAHENHGAGVGADDLARGLDTALERHDDVHGGQVGLELMVQADGLDAVHGFAGDLVAPGDEDLLEHVAHENRIVDHQNALEHGVDYCSRGAGFGEIPARGPIELPGPAAQAVKLVPSALAV
jgi:hypothetical protein